MVRLEAAERSGRLEAFNASDNVRDTIEPGMEARADRISEIRRAIAEGTYETPEKIVIVACRVLDDLRSGS